MRRKQIEKDAEKMRKEGRELDYLYEENVKRWKDEKLKKKKQESMNRAHILELKKKQKMPKKMEKGM